MSKRRKITALTIKEISAVDVPAQEGALTEFRKSEQSSTRENAQLKEGAMPDENIDEVKTQAEPAQQPQVTKAVVEQIAVTEPQVTYKALDGTVYDNESNIKLAKQLDAMLIDKAAMNFPLVKEVVEDVNAIVGAVYGNEDALKALTAIEVAFAKQAKEKADAEKQQADDIAKRSQLKGNVVSIKAGDEDTPWGTDEEVQQYAKDNNMPISKARVELGSIAYVAGGK